MQEKFHDKAIRIVYEYLVDNEELPSGFSEDDVTVVWFCKTLKNWKAMVIAHLPDNYFFEVTYNGAREEAYLDVYEKIRNIKIEDNPHITVNVSPAVTQWGSDRATASVTRIRVA